MTSLAGYSFSKPSLLDEALTHPSLSGTYNYQRLEFLGDRVLGLSIAGWLLEAYPAEAEGKLNRRFTALVRKETLAQLSVKLGIADALKLTPGAESEGTRNKEAVLADVCESFIGAMYLDAGFDVVDAFIRKHWIPLIDLDTQGVKDHKTKLQEWCQARGKSLPAYTVIDRTGPDHSPIFTIEAAVEGVAAAQASGGSKKTAEQDAAAALLEQLIAQ